MRGAKRAAVVPYGGGLLPPLRSRRSPDRARIWTARSPTLKTDGLKPIRTVGVMMLGAKRAEFTPTSPFSPFPGERLRTQETLQEQGNLRSITCARKALRRPLVNHVCSVRRPARSMYILS